MNKPTINLTINLKELFSGYRWAAKDSAGYWYVYQYKPVLSRSKKYWVETKGRCMGVGPKTFNFDGSVADSLFKL